MYLDKTYETVLDFEQMIFRNHFGCLICMEYLYQKFSKNEVFFSRR